MYVQSTNLMDYGPLKDRGFSFWRDEKKTVTLRLIHVLTSSMEKRSWLK